MQQAVPTPGPATTQDGAMDKRRNTTCIPMVSVLWLQTVVSQREVRSL